MTNLNAMAVFTARVFLPVAVVFSLMACSEEKSEPLPDLPPIEIPKEVPGVYSGSLPCDDCTSRMVKISLAENHSAEVVQLTLRDTMESDTLVGTYAVTDSAIKISLSEDKVHWNFKRIKFGNLRYMTSAGVPYEDKDGLHADLIRIFKVPLKPIKDSSKSAVVDSSAVDSASVLDSTTKAGQPRE